MDLSSCTPGSPSEFFLQFCRYFSPWEFKGWDPLSLQQAHGSYLGRRPCEKHLFHSGEILESDRLSPHRNSELLTDIQNLLSCDTRKDQRTLRMGMNHPITYEKGRGMGTFGYTGIPHK